jgi:PBSX family phage terminase large subunit
MRTSDLVAPGFYDLWNADKYFTYIAARGGRSSGKSSTISLRLVKKIMTLPINVLIVRKVANTLLTSCYEQIKWAINSLGVNHYFKCTVSPMRITYLPTGQAFLFMGADKPGQLKSFKMSNFPITDIWFEEVDEHRTENDVNVIEDSIVRGTLPDGLKFTVWYSYNPPKRRTNWTNLKFDISSKTLFVHKSDYTMNPWAGPDVHAKAEEKRKHNEMFYRWYWLGEPVGGALRPFNNVVIKEFNIDKLTNISQGLDFGWTAPMAHSRHALVGQDLYLFGEMYKVKMGLDTYYKRILDHKWNDFMIYGDSEDARSIDDLKAKGLRIRKATKGGGSVTHGLDWLDGLNSIYIHPTLCPNGAREFNTAEYKIDKDGNCIDELDGSIHFIDATRYGCEKFMGRDLNAFFKGGN